MWTAEDRERYKDDGRRYPSNLTDVEWDLVRPLFEIYPTLTKNIREMVNGCLYLGAEGCRWRSLPKDFGPWQTVRGYRDRFCRDGVWADAAAAPTPAARGPRPPRREPDTVDRDRGFAERHLGTAEGRARRRRQQEGQGHQAPPPDLLVRLRPRGLGLRREPARHARPGAPARAGGRGRVGPAAGPGWRGPRRPGRPGGRGGAPPPAPRS